MRDHVAHAIQCAIPFVCGLSIGFISGWKHDQLMLVSGLLGWFAMDVLRAWIRRTG